MKRPLRLDVSNTALKRLDDLISIWRTYHSDQRVEELVDELYDQAEWLCVYPRAGAVEEWLSKGRFQYRRWVVGHVKIIYRVTRTAVRVTDFFDSRQDPKKMKG